MCLGGKLTHQITMSNSDIAALSSLGTNVKSALKATFGVGSVGGSTNVEKDEEQKEQLKHFDYQTETLIMGGRVPRDVSDPDSLAQWSDSVEELPMPVRFRGKPEGFCSFFLRISFSLHLKYYSTRFYYLNAQKST